MRARSSPLARTETVAVVAGLMIGLGLAAPLSTGSVPVPWADRAAPAEASEERAGASEHTPEPSTPAPAANSPSEEPSPARTGAPETTGSAVVPSPAQPTSAAAAPQDRAPTSGTGPSAPPQDAGADKAPPGAPDAPGLGGPTPSPDPTETRTATGTQGPEGDGRANREDRTGLPLLWWLAG